MIDTLRAELKILAGGGDIMKKILSKLIKLILKKLHRKKQPTVKAVNSIIISININKD